MRGAGLIRGLAACAFAIVAPAGTPPGHHRPSQYGSRQDSELTRAVRTRLKLD